MKEIDLWREHARVLSIYPDPMLAARVDFRSRNSENIKAGQEPFPQLSVVVPAFNEVDRIERILASLDAALTRAPVPVEIIVVNNKSDDQTGEIARDFGVSVIDERRRGIGNARQAGLEVTKTTSIHVLTTDADCLVSEDWITKHYQVLVDSNVCYTYGQVMLLLDQRVSPRDALLFPIYLAGLEVTRGIKRMALQYVPMTGQNCGFKREHAFGVGGYRCELAAHEDCFLYLDIQKQTGGKAVNSQAKVLSSGRRIVGAGIIRYALSRLAFNFNYYMAGQELDSPAHYNDYR